MPLSRLLVGVGDLEDGFLGEGLADNLQADGQAVSKAAGDGNGRHTGNIYRQGTDIA